MDPHNPAHRRKKALATRCAAVDVAEEVVDVGVRSNARGLDTQVRKIAGDMLGFACAAAAAAATMTLNWNDCIKTF